MKKLLFLLSFIFIAFISFSQLNVTYQGQVTYAQETSDVWGYVAPDSTEYAIVGIQCGVSIVDLSDPSDPTEVAFIDGACSTWRDIKTWGQHAYVTNETSNGVMVIDLTGLPAVVSFYDWTPNIPGLGTLSSVHNIYIDEFGYAYLAGSNLNNGGLLYVDCFTDPGNPEFVGAGPSIYSHDVYARDNKMYSSEIYEGVFSVYDVSDKSNTILLGSQGTSGEFTHNTWLSDDGTILYTTDEVSDAPVGAYDITDLSDIQHLDDFLPYETLGTGVIPHNVHVWEDWLIISYYTDGCILVDGSNPSNLVEVGNFDTFLQNVSGFGGAWGAYPYLPSGLILISDMQSGLYVLEPNYVNACWLEGNITDASNSIGINGADIQILGTNVVDESGFDGAYATGYAVSGDYDVTVTKGGYEPATVTATLENGVITILDVALQPLVPFGISGTVIEMGTGTPVADAKVKIFNEDFTYELDADASGNFNIASFFEGEYDVIGGKWGYSTTVLENAFDMSNASVTIEIEPGYSDIFSLDLGWTFTEAPVQGTWVLVDPPNGLSGGAPFDIAPGIDSDDPGTGCYVTGDGTVIDNTILIGGSTLLSSPEFDLTSYDYASISYELWYLGFNQFTQSPTDVPMFVALSNGVDTAVVDSIVYADLAPIEWQYSEIDVEEHITPTANMQIHFLATTSDDFAQLAEGGVDDFQVFEGTPSSIEVIAENVLMNAYPNPSSEGFTLAYDLLNQMENARLEVFNNLGQLVEQRSLNNNAGMIELGAEYTRGLYHVRIMNANEIGNAIQVIKQ
ncbi:MAG: choice-of-anchor B family protein [Flavobacteriales bacterium]|nr:choice-of-anchor B family protein [Flavobacteriales bacterium]